MAQWAFAFMVVGVAWAIAFTRVERIRAEARIKAGEIK